MRTDAISELLEQVANRLILPRFRSLTSDQIHEKAPGDLVTIADQEAEVAIREVLSAAYPTAVIIGEEGVSQDPGELALLAGAAHAWLIDPVDGTRNFTRGSPDFAVMVAEVREAQTVRAWIWQPIHQRLYVAEQGAGVSRNGRALPARRPATHPPIGATYARERGVSRTVRVIRPAGACGIDYPRLVEGERDFLHFRALHPGITCPGP
ncbi:MAG: inositol monophosphatase [Micropruina sp.]|nr:inositol monophosphatase [Micropruina sp.]